MLNIKMTLSKAIYDRIIEDVEWYDGIHCLAMNYLESTDKALICEVDVEEALWTRDDENNLIPTGQQRFARTWYVVTADGIYHEHCFENKAYGDYRSVR